MGYLGSGKNLAGWEKNRWSFAAYRFPFLTLVSLWSSSSHPHGCAISVVQDREIIFLVAYCIAAGFSFSILMWFRCLYSMLLPSSCPIPCKPCIGERGMCDG